ncbi:MAG TPA: methyltransferase domain-containing protein [Acidimicrobiales bacterium]|nr:methyltransferase domain-containing protein [Acidimicrobiales bacterium]
MTDPRVDPVAARFGAVAAEYDHGRPSYPSAVLDRLAAVVGLGPGTDVLDLAAGTGKLTRQLVATGASVVAVEPSEGMRELLVASLPGVPALDGTAEAIPLPDGAVDLVTVGQAFPWFRTADALDEIHRVLRPGGWLALLANEAPTTGWARDLWDLRHRLTGYSASYPGNGWSAVVDADLRFGPRRSSETEVEVATTAEQVMSDSASRSYVMSRDAAAQKRVLDAVAALLADHPDVAGRTELTYERPCSLHLCQRLA